MTRPMTDGRTVLERARELRKLGGYDAHERSGEVHDVMIELLKLVEEVVRFTLDPRAAPDVARRVLLVTATPYCTYDGSPVSATMERFK